MTVKILVLGGSWFLGRAVVEGAIARGWEVTTFRRGHSGEDVAGSRTVRGDRTSKDDLSRLARSGPWDAVLDTSGYVPRETLNVARALEQVAARAVFVSTVSVYEGWPVEPLTEDSAVLYCPADAGAEFGYDGDPGPSVYGFTKSGCERAVVDTFGTDRSAILRPGVILGPREYVGRLPWWLGRVARGGRVLAPGQPDRVIQPVDVRDVAAFALDCAAQVSGVFNVAGSGVDTMGAFLSACRDATGSDAEFAWVSDEEWLVAQGVSQWTELPLWRTYPGVWAVDSGRARANGLALRTLRSTVADTWNWLHSQDDGVRHERNSEQGIDPAKEAAILAAWDAREAGRRSRP
ncbi:NAD-dependent epimerase/dehydratase family protein [Actinokineospora sp.]|uniref:NAD-dependent epimerase/dehydratase family protein n=1 Tax=Actinokineospora sp. TaxID=1872133 RepID=UPI0040378892